MFDVKSLVIFASAAFILAITPGPAVLYIVTRTVTQGRRAGMASCLGVAVGAIVHVLAAALGLAALLLASARAFDIVKYAGALYLVYLGIQRFLQPSRLSFAGRTETHAVGRIFRDGVVVNVLNPKTAIFLLAFLPQFVVPARGDVPLQITALGALSILISLVTNASWSLAAERATGWLTRHPRFVALERYVSGSVYCGLGLAAALSGLGRRG